MKYIIITEEFYKRLYKAYKDMIIYGRGEILLDEECFKIEEEE